MIKMSDSGRRRERRGAWFALRGLVEAPARIGSNRHPGRFARRGTVMLAAIGILASSTAMLASDVPIAERQLGGKARAAHGERAQRALDRTLAELVFERLVRHTTIGSKIDVTASDGTVALAGTVPSTRAKQRATRIARQTPGVAEVENTLLVQAPTRDGVKPQRTQEEIARTDAELAEKVARTIAKQIPGTRAGEDWWFSGWRVEGRDNVWNMVVEADDGDVTLEGEVPGSSVIATAVKAARDVEGVAEVHSELESEPYAGLVARAGAPTGYPFLPYYSYVYAYESDVACQNQAAARGAQQPGASSSEKHERATPEQRIRGQVTGIDRTADLITIRADGGSTLTVPLPDDGALAKGDQVVLDLAVRESTAAGDVRQQ